MLSSHATKVQHAAPRARHSTLCAYSCRLLEHRESDKDERAVQPGGRSGRSAASSKRAAGQPQAVTRVSCSKVAQLAAGAIDPLEGTIHGMQASQSLELPDLQGEGT